VPTFRMNRLLHCQLPWRKKAADAYQKLLHAFQTTWRRIPECTARDRRMITN